VKRRCRSQALRRRAAPPRRARLAAVGLGIGIVVSLALTRVMATLLFGVGARDPMTFVGVGGLLALVSVVACYIPARRAMRVDPVVALRI